MVLVYGLVAVPAYRTDVLPETFGLEESGLLLVHCSENQADGQGGGSTATARSARAQGICPLTGGLLRVTGHGGVLQLRQLLTVAGSAPRGTTTVCLIHHGRVAGA